MFVSAKNGQVIHICMFVSAKKKNGEVVNTSPAFVIYVTKKKRKSQIEKR